MQYPILLQPICKDYIWGGTKLRTKYNKRCGLDTIAESWELAVHEDGICRIGNGQYAGMLFSEYLEQEGNVLGSRAEGELPLLVKYIDSEGKLSVQVHPDDAYAKKHHNSPGKTEFWYIMDCEEGAELYYGIKENLTKDEFRQKAKDGSIEDALNTVAVQPGDIFMIPPGLVHAIGENMTVAEIGTNCNITYRIYDYGRVDDEGNPRPLHVDRAADVFKLDKGNTKWIDNQMDCGPFTVHDIELHGIMDRQAPTGSFECLMCVEGSCMVDKGAEMQAGSSVFIPAGLPYTLNGEAKILSVHV